MMMLMMTARMKMKADEHELSTHLRTTVSVRYPVHSGGMALPEEMVILQPLATTVLHGLVDGLWMK